MTTLKESLLLIRGMLNNKSNWLDHPINLTVLTITETLDDVLLHFVPKEVDAKNPEEQLEEQRKHFEDRAFNQRFLMSIQRVGDGPFGLQPVGCPTLDEFVARDADGDYKDQTLNAMWWAWQEALKH